MIGMGQVRKFERAYYARKDNWPPELQRLGLEAFYALRCLAWGEPKFRAEFIAKVLAFETALAKQPA